MAPTAPALLRHAPTHLPTNALGFFPVIELTDGLARVLECRVVRIDLDLGQQAGGMARATSLAQCVFQRLDQKIGDPALGMGDADIQGHRRNGVARHRLAHQDLADDRAVAMGDHQLVVEQGQWQQGLGGLGGNVLLLPRGSLDVLGMGGVPANGDEDSVRDVEGICHCLPLPVRSDRAQGPGSGVGIGGSNKNASSLKPRDLGRAGLRIVLGAGDGSDNRRAAGPGMGA